MAESQEGGPTLAQLVLEAARKEREKGKIGQEEGDGAPAGGMEAGQGGGAGEPKKTDFATLASGFKRTPSRRPSNTGSRLSVDSSPGGPPNAADNVRNKLSKGGRRQSASPYTSLSDEHEDGADEPINPQVGGGVMGRTLGKLAEVAGVREAQTDGPNPEAADNDALRAAKEADEAGILRGPFSITDSKRGQKKASAGSARLHDGEGTGEGKGKGKKSYSRANSEAGAGAGQGQSGAQGVESAGEEDQKDKDKEGKEGKEKEGKEKEKSAGQKGWSTLRAKLGTGSAAGSKPKDTQGLTKALSGHELTTELTTGLLPIIMLKMSMDRDEHGQHRVPVLMNYLKLRITDSVHPFHAAHAVFRIELEYGDKLLKWVIYRELRDFFNLHTAYRAANIVARGIQEVDLPPFPKTSLPYFNLLKREGRAVSKADFARIQRYALEDYLLKLIRATMFRPEANRLCKFLEVSALSIALATRGGFQGKQGYLRVMSSNASRRASPGFHPIEWKERREPKWFIVRESYLVSVDEPDQSAIFDVFLVDDEFQIERPTRLIKQGIHLFDKLAPSLHRGEEEDGDADGEGGDEEGDGGKKDKKMKHKGGAKGEAQLRGDSTPDGVGDPEDPSTTDLAAADPRHLRNASSHTFYIINAERRIKVVAKNERQMDQFIASIERMAARCIWAGKNRFESFAPIRMNVAAQWLIDGRDYFWNLSRAILLAKERIYIHDWWLSPELYLRRPPALNQKWRLDRLLKRKADEGVQIFVIVYKEVSNGFTPVDSEYTKKRLLALSPNIHIQRSPSHTGTGNLLWSHHEKMCVIDETIAFMGGLDLCFGRWDSPGHVLIDDAPGGMDEIEKHDAKNGQVEHLQIWPGKDYSNQRVSDFFNLKSPEEDMYDRQKVPRQPWHDIGLQLVGQPARDLCRHFAQRWNYLLRTKNHSRVMPFLLPPADFTPKQLQNLGIVGTCEAQICRSCGPWSIGTPDKVEHSIQNAYIKAIQLSDHFVYIENQFFVSSAMVEGTKITNQIGDALVDRAIRAHEEGTPWRAIIVIPTMPGYPSPLNEDAAGSVRLIVECQNKSICRGETSIYGRLKARGIQPEEYITFFSLRSWGKLQSGQLTSEGVYIHAKAMIVDDRLAIIGSANINERSQRGDRDSELACVIRDTDMVDSVMAGKPYKVGRFAHSMRVRLMREHLGVDVDALEAEENSMDLLDRRPDGELRFTDAEYDQTEATTKTEKKDRKAEANGKPEVNGKPKANGDQGQEQEARQTSISTEPAPWDPDQEQKKGQTKSGVTSTSSHFARAGEVGRTLAGTVSSIAGGAAESVAISGSGAMEGVGKSGKVANALLKEEDTGPDTYEVDDPHDGQPDGAPNTAAEELVAGTQSKEGFASTKAPTLEEKVLAEGRPSKSTEEKPPGRPGLKMESVHATNDNDASTTKPGEGKPQDNLQGAEGQKVTQESGDTGDVSKLDAHAAKQGKKEDIEEVADENKPAAGKEQPPQSFANGHANTMEEGKDEAVANNNYYAKEIRRHLTAGMTPINIPTGASTVDPKGFADPVADNFFKEVWLPIAVRNTQIFRKVFRCVPDDNVTTWQGYKEYQTWENRHSKPLREEGGEDGGEDTLSPIDDKDSRSRGLSPGAQSTRERSASAADGGERMAHRKTISKGQNKIDQGFSQQERDQMEEVLKEVRGNLILFPTRFMEAEDLNNNFLFSKDRLPPLSIYN